MSLAEYTIMPCSCKDSDVHEFEFTYERFKNEYDTPLKDWLAVQYIIDAFPEGTVFEIKLLKKPIILIGWFNIYPNYYDGLYDTKEHADNIATNKRIACIQISYKPGEGLE